MSSNTWPGSTASTMVACSQESRARSELPSLRMGPPMEQPGILWQEACRTTTTSGTAAWRWPWSWAAASFPPPLNCLSSGRTTDNLSSHSWARLTGKYSSLIGWSKTILISDWLFTGESRGLSRMKPSLQLKEPRWRWEVEMWASKPRRWDSLTQKYFLHKYFFCSGGRVLEDIVTWHLHHGGLCWGLRSERSSVCYCRTESNHAQHHTLQGEL